MNTQANQVNVAGNKPQKKFSAGAISATIWQNKCQNKEGKEYEYASLSLDRRYKDKEGNWQSTGSMRLPDVPKAVVVLSKAYEYLTLREYAQAE